MTGSKLNTASFPISSAVDANGWTVTDYGTHKEATKVVSATEFKVRFETTTRNSSNLPAGVANTSVFKEISATIEPGNFSDMVTLTRINTAIGASLTSISAIYMYLGPATATSYTVPVRFYVKW